MPEPPGAGTAGKATDANALVVDSGLRSQEPGESGALWL